MVLCVCLRVNRNLLYMFNSKGGTHQNECYNLLVLDVQQFFKYNTTHFLF